MKIKAYVDGSIRPKSHGVVSIGVVFIKSGTIIHELSENLGILATSQTAELLAILRALHEAKKMDITDIRLFSDNIGNVNTLNNKETNCNGENVNDYCVAISHLEKYFTKVSYVWISKEENQLADMLAKGGHEKPQINYGNGIKKLIENLKGNSSNQRLYYFKPYVFVEHTHHKGVFYRVNLENKECTCSLNKDSNCIHIEKAIKGLSLEKSSQLSKNNE